MDSLPVEVRNQLARTVQAARRAGEEGARSALGVLAVGDARAHPSLLADEQDLRRRLRAHGRQLGDRLDAETGAQQVERLVHEVAYEHWHRMLFARFLAENDLLRSDDPGLAVPLAPETRQELERLLEAPPPAVFAARDSLGWTYQFWQAERKETVNKSGVKIGADELPAVTQLFTERYMVLFLLQESARRQYARSLPMTDRPDAPLVRGESDLLVFISSVMTKEMEPARLRAVQTLRDLPFSRPWAFEYTPANSEDVTDAYLGKVEEADFVVWLVGVDTSQPVVDEINACIASGGRLLAFKFKSDDADETTRALIETVSDYAKWHDTPSLDAFAKCLRETITDELVRALRDPGPPIRRRRLNEQLRLSVAKCKQAWSTLGVPRDLAAELAADRDLGNVLQLPDSGVQVVVGDMGVGKTLAVSRLFQQAIGRAHADSSQPFPLFVNARDLQGSLSDYIDEKSTSLFDPSVQESLLIVDGLDEVGVTRANHVLDEARVYGDANSRFAAVLTSRTLPGLRCVGEDDCRVEMPTLDDEQSFRLMSRIAGRPVDLQDSYGWSESIRHAAKRPLFAIMLGLELKRRPGFGFQRPSQLVKCLAQAALQDMEGDTGKNDELLQKLAIKTITTGRRTRKCDVSFKQSEQMLLTNSRLVDEDGVRIDFTLHIFREWYAARALVEGTMSVDDVLPAADRWIVPFVLTVDSENQEIGNALMHKLATSDPGLASLVMTELWNERHHDEPDDVLTGSSTEIGQQLWDAMDAWRHGLGRLFEEVGPVDVEGGTASIGVRMEDATETITTSWYRGPEKLDPVVELPKGDWRELCNSLGPDWPVLHGEMAPRAGGRSRGWPWLRTKSTLTDSLSDALKSRRLALISEDAVRELTWTFALAVMNQGCVSPKLIRSRWILRHIDDIEEVIDRERGNPEAEYVYRNGTKEFLGEEIVLVKRCLLKLMERENDIVSDPWPARDVKEPADNWVWSFYSNERLLERANAIYGAALRTYESMVDRWFCGFRNRLRLYRLLPVRLEGRLTCSRTHESASVGPSLTWWTRSLPAGEQSAVVIEMGGREDFDHFSYWREEEENLKKLHPEYETPPALPVSGGGGAIFNDRPATDLAQRWLIDELRELGWDLSYRGL